MGLDHLRKAFQIITEYFYYSHALPEAHNEQCVNNKGKIGTHTTEFNVVDI